MTQVAYLQCPTGIAGDMCLGALVDAGVPLNDLCQKLALLGISEEYQLRAETVHRQGQAATKVFVDLLQSSSPSFPKPHHTPHRRLPDIEQMILQAKLPPRAETWSLEVFRQLAKAEAAVHGIAPEKVHFHEVGATDAIVDIVGTCLGLDWLNIEQLYCSALPTGGGIIRAAHGQLPVPAPATLKLMEMGQVPVYSNGIDKELVTPTGAAIIVTLANGFGSPPTMTLQKVGLGAGSTDLPLPNILRLWLGETSGSQVQGQQTRSTQETVAVLETQIDDLSPQAIAYTFDALFNAGAVDVFTQPVTMKKSRLGVLLTVICPPEAIPACETILFQETTTLGIRRSLQQRTALARTLQSVETVYGSVRVKVGFDGDQIFNVHPEYEDCAQLAQQHQVSWLTVHRTALETWYSLEGNRV
jgi:hypothetical protein